MYKRNNCKSFAESFLKIAKGKISTMIRTLCRVIIPVPMWVFLTGIRGSFRKIHKYNMIDHCLDSI